MLVSDGEDTCNSDPLPDRGPNSNPRPNLTISTIGFQNRRTHRRTTTLHRHCHRRIVHPSRQHHPLTTRLIAIQNLDTANKLPLTPTGLGDIRLGQTLTDIHATHPDFPTTTSSANTITWATATTPSPTEP